MNISVCAFVNIARQFLLSLSKIQCFLLLIFLFSVMLKLFRFRWYGKKVALVQLVLYSAPFSFPLTKWKCNALFYLLNYYQTWIFFGLLTLIYVVVFIFCDIYRFFSLGNAMNSLSCFIYYFSKKLNQISGTYSLYIFYEKDVPAIICLLYFLPTEIFTQHISCLIKISIKDTVRSVTIIF